MGFSGEVNGMKQYFYVGSYCGGGEDSIHLLELDGGNLRKVYGNSQVDSPSYLAVNHAGTRLYAVSERLDGGEVYAFAILETGELKLLNKLPTTGGYSCHVAVDPAGSCLAVANYQIGTLDIFTLNGEGALKERLGVLRHEGRGPNAQRQECAHTHFAAFCPEDSSRLLAVDLGTDSVYCYQIHPSENRVSLWGRVAVPAGKGPRHIVFSKRHPGIFYLVCELGLCVYTVKRTETGGELIGCQPCMPEDFQGVCGAAAIRLSEDGRYLYVSNRVYEPEEGMDCIAVFATDSETGCLGGPRFFRTGYTEPRDINLFGGYLVAAFQSGNRVVAYERDRTTGELAGAAGQLALGKASCLAGWDYRGPCRP